MRSESTEIRDEDILDCLRNEQFDKGFKLLMDKYEKRIYTQVRRVLDRHEDANDAMQNCLVKIFKNIKKFKGDSKLYTWIYRIATNEAITISNKLKKQYTMSLENEKGSVDIAAESYTTSEMIEEKLSAALKLLPTKQRLVFSMRFYEDMSYKEMSEIMDLTEGGLKASYYHAVKKIETFLTS